jgi:hypothetical protein
MIAFLNIVIKCTTPIIINENIITNLDNITIFKVIDEIFENNVKSAIKAIIASNILLCPIVITISVPMDNKKNPLSSLFNELRSTIKNNIESIDAIYHNSKYTPYTNTVANIVKIEPKCIIFLLAHSPKENELKKLFNFL